MDLFLKLAWLAGIIDGEGCISVYYSQKPRRHRDGHLERRLEPFVTITNTNEWIIREVQDIAKLIGVEWNVQLSVDRKKPDRKPCWTISFKASIRAAKLLMAVMPYLVGKKRQAELVLELIKHRRNIIKFGHLARRHGHSLLDDKSIRLAEDVRNLNAKGRQKELRI